MAQKDQKFINIIGAGLVVVALVAGLGYGWWSINQAPVADPATLITTNQPKTISKSQDTLKVLVDLKRYGNWPIGVVTLSPDRGNPFAPKR